MSEQKTFGGVSDEQKEIALPIAFSECRAEVERLTRANEYLQGAKQIVRDELTEHIQTQVQLEAELAASHERERKLVEAGDKGHAIVLWNAAVLVYDMFLGLENSDPRVMKVVDELKRRARVFDKNIDATALSAAKG